MAVQVHQLLHGYRGGHGQIAASVRLPNRDSELVTRLSDLSGSLTSGLQFDSYLTIYPLPSREFFAVARTWPDPNTPRAGCVLTHTLLLPVSYWSSHKNVRSINLLFQDPRIPGYDYTEALTLNHRSPTVRQLKVDVDPITCRRFVSRYFGKGIRPVVWLAVDHPDEILWRLLERLWPRLRAVFSCCTFSLQQRNLEDGPFDLLFAPASVYSRFLKLSPEHLIEPGSVRKDPSEAWSDYWVRALFTSEPGAPMDQGELALWDELGEDPTAVRKISLIRELRARASLSPTAGVGAIDVVESLAREAGNAIAFKRGVLDDAINAVATAPPDQALMSLRLIEDRLHRDSFRMVSEDFVIRVSAAVAAATIRDPKAVLESGEFWRAESATGGSNLARGVVEGLRDLAIKNPSRLDVLRSRPDIAEEIFRLEPTFAATYLRVGGREAPLILAEWLASTRDFETLRLVRRSILPLLSEQLCDLLLPSLLRDLRDEEVSETLADLFILTNGFVDHNVQAVVGERVSKIHPDAVRNWASQSVEWSEGLAAVVALSYQQNRQGFYELLNDEKLDRQRKVEVVVSTIRRLASCGHPYWLREIASGDIHLMRLLFLSGTGTKNVAEIALPFLLNEVDLPIGRDDDVIGSLLSFSGRPVFPELLYSGMRSVITSYIVEGRDSAAMRAFQESPESTQWLQEVPDSRLIDLLVKACGSSPMAVPRAWMWVARAPRSLFERKSPILPDLCDGLLRYSHRSFSEGMEASLLEVFRRSTKETTSEVCRSLAAKMLRFAFDHVSLPLGAVVAETFAEAYAVSLEEDHRPSSIFAVLFGSHSWDRAKDLRISLIDAFLRSNWAPADLAIAADKAGILRKVFKRIHRRNGGDKYLQSMLQDVSGRDDPKLRLVHEELVSMSNAPNFYEEWD